MNRSSSSRVGSSQGSASSTRTSPSQQPQPQPQPLEEHEFRNMTSRVIHSGRDITLPEPELGNLVSQLRRFGWEGIMNNLSDRVNDPLIYDFYGRLRYYFENDDISRPAIVTVVAGRQIILNRTNLSFLLGVPDEGECIFFKKKPEDFQNALLGIDTNLFYRTFANANFTGGRMFENHLLEEYRNLNVFLEANILPKAGTNNSVSKFQGFIIYCVAHNRKLNLPYIILKYMGDIINNKSMGLGYGRILCKIFMNLGIDVDNNNSTRSKLPISQRTLNLRNTHPFKNRQEESQPYDPYEPQQQHEEQQQQYEPQQQHEEQLQQQQFFEPPQPVYNPYTQEFSLDQLGEDLNYDLYNYRF